MVVACSSVAGLRTARGAGVARTLQKRRSTLRALRTGSVAAAAKVPAQQHGSTWRSFYGVEMSVSPGGMRLYDLFALATRDEVRKLLEHEFGSSGGLLRPVTNLRLLLDQGLDVRLHAIDEDGKAESVPLHDRLCFHLNDGGEIRFRVLSASRANRVDCEGALSGPSTTYQPYLATAGSQHTLELISSQLLAAEESAERRKYAAVCEQIGWEVSVNLEELPQCFHLPSCTGWPTRPPQRPLLFEGDELEYGHNDLEGLGDSLGESFWESLYDDTLLDGSS